jgi:hypothetical protein
VPSFSLHQGMTVDGKTFESFLGNDRFEKKIMSKFDNFLHESFGKRFFQRLWQFESDIRGRLDQEECAAQALSNECESIKSSDSEDDERTKESQSDRSISELKQEKSKRISRNKRLLMELCSIAEGSQDKHV